MRWLIILQGEQIDVDRLLNELVYWDGTAPAPPAS
jgi:hypothetical protein